MAIGAVDAQRNRFAIGAQSKFSSNIHPSASLQPCYCHSNIEGKVYQMVNLTDISGWAALLLKKRMSASPEVLMNLLVPAISTRVVL